MEMQYPIDFQSVLQPGDLVPVIYWTDKSGYSKSTADLEGNFLLITLFSLNCPHCLNTLLYLQKQDSSDGTGKIIILAIGRGSDEAELKEFAVKYGINLIIIPDPFREIYSKFAFRIVPLNYLFGPQGQLLFYLKGFHPDKIQKMLNY